MVGYPGAQWRLGVGDKACRNPAANMAVGELLHHGTLSAPCLKRCVTLRRWLLGWEAWVALHVLVAWFMPSVLRALAAQPQAGGVPGPGAHLRSAKGQKWVDWLGLPSYHVMMVALIPALVGYAPFSRRLSALQLLRSLVASL